MFDPRPDVRRFAAEIGRVELQTSDDLFFDPYRINRRTGSFILIDPDDNTTVGAGMIRDAARGFAQATLQPRVIEAFRNEVDAPELGADDVLVRVHMTAICGTDACTVRYCCSIWSSRSSTNSSPPPGSPGIEERQLPQAFGQIVEVEFDVGEGIPGGREAHFGAAGFGFPHHGQWRVRHAVMIRLLPHFAVTAHCQLEHFRQRVDHRYAHAMQAAGHLVGVVVEFAAGVQHRHDHFRRRDTFFVNFSRDTAAVIGYGYRFVRMDSDLNLGAVASERFIDGIVYQLKHHVMKTGAVIGIANVHSRALTHRIQPLQDLDAGGIVTVTMLFAHTYSAGIT